GYNTLGYFAPHAAYSSSGSGGGQVLEFKTMVKELHAAGIEVILDVVYNHTAEGDHTGPTLSFKGIDNGGYYRLGGGDHSRYTDYTGCGNTLDVRRPPVLALLMDSPRYWVTEMHGDCVRFDLAYRLTGSSDLYRSDGRRPFASVNFVTAHDGFTMADLVAYEQKRNEANGEDNRDGESHNRNWNSGIEGPTDDRVVLELRGRQ